jgi:alpha-ketoglutaric semialdehyde dehydrogenase
MSQKVLIAGDWRTAGAAQTFRATNPSSGEPLPELYPVSSLEDVDRALEAGRRAAEELAEIPGARRGDFLEAFAARIERRAGEIVAMAHLETALPQAPRLAEVELPRTIAQLRQAAAAAREGSWSLPVIDTRANIRSRFGPLGGPVAVFGPNNFPLAFNSAAGGDFAAAIAAGNPVIAKANTSHPGTTRLFAEEAFAAARETGLPPATVQLLYRLRHEDGAYLVSHPLLGATAYTGSRASGLELKEAADQAGKPIYLELSSINPVFILPGALRERAEEIAGEFVASALMGSGQFCTNPGLVVLLAGNESESFAAAVAARFDGAPPGPLLGARIAGNLAATVRALQEAGAELVTGGSRLEEAGFRFQNTLLKASGSAFLSDPPALQCEAFGNSSLFVLASSAEQMVEIASSLEGNLTGSIYSARDGADDTLYAGIAPRLRRRVGRLLNDKMPTGVAVSPAMNHGGPYPATGHPGFTAVGIPAALRRFAMLECYDNVRESRLPPELRDRNPGGGLWRSIDGEWTRADVSAGAQ